MAHLSFPEALNAGVDSEALMWGRLATCGGLPTRQPDVSTVAEGRPIANRPQDAILPHIGPPTRPVSKTRSHECERCTHECVRHDSPARQAGKLEHVAPFANCLWRAAYA